MPEESLLGMGKYGRMSDVVEWFEVIVLGLLDVMMIDIP